MQECQGGRGGRGEGGRWGGGGEGGRWEEGGEEEREMWGEVRRRGGGSCAGDVFAQDFGMNQGEFA